MAIMIIFGLLSIKREYGSLTNGSILSQFLYVQIPPSEASRPERSKVRLDIFFVLFLSVLFLSDIIQLKIV